MQILLAIIFLLFLSNGISACEGNCVNGFGKQNYRGEGWSATAEGNWVEKESGESYMANGKWSFFDNSGKPTEVWEGNFNEKDIPHGKATVLTLVNGNKTICEYIEGECLKGIIESSDGSIYKGEMKFNENKNIDEKNGKGTLIYADGSEYEGIWNKNKKEGKGTFIAADKTKYSQSWKNGKLKNEKLISYAGGEDSKCEKGNCINGKGKKIWINGRVYEGDFKDGLRHGIGLNKINGNEYNGGFKEDKVFGKGSYKVNCSFTVIGNFVEGKIDGEATVEFGDCNKIHKLGEKFVGNINGWPDNSINDLYVGEIIYNNGNKYIGEVKNQTFVRHGQGEFLWKDQKYVGGFQNGFRHGKGIYTWDSGGSYDGEWKRGKKHGNGVMTYKDGTIDDGEWYKNDFVPRLKTKVEKKWKKAVTCYRDNNKGDRDPNSFLAKGHMDVLAQNIEMQKQTGNFFSYVDTITDQSNRIIDLLGC